MMKRALVLFPLLAIGIAPALADPHGPHGPAGRMPGRIGLGPFGGGDPAPRFGGRADFDDEPLPPPVRRRPDQDRARDQMRSGAIRPLREIQQQWRQDMPGYDFIGSDYDPGAGSYRLKFLRDGSVIWIDVDGRTGREIGRRGR